MHGSWEHKSSSPPLGLGSHFVQTGWKILFVCLITLHFPQPNESLLCTASFELPLQPLNNFPTSDYCHYRTRTLVGYNLFLKNTGLSMWNKESSSVYLLLYKDTQKGILYECMCMQACMLIPLKTRKFQWCSNFFSHSGFACFTETHGHVNIHIYLYIITCISIFMHRHVSFNIFTKKT